MKTTQLLILLIILWCSQICFGLEYVCVLWKDSYFHFVPKANETNSTLVNIWTSGRVGWTGLSFSNTTQTNSSGLFFIAGPNRGAVTNVHQNGERIDMIPYGMEIDDSAYLKVDNIYHFSVMIPNDLLYSRYFLFAQSLDRLDNSTIPYHSKAGHKPNPLWDPSLNIDIDYCSPQYLRIPGRLGALNLWTALIFIGIYVVLISLYLYYRDEPLIAVRGYGFVLCAVCFSLNLVGDLILTFSESYERSILGNCLLSPLVLYSMTVMPLFTCIMQFVRFMFILNINVRKQQSMKIGSKPILPILVRLASYITSPLVLLIVPFIWLVLWLILTTVILSTIGCGIVSALVLRVMFIVSCVGLCLFAAVIYVFDVVQNFKNIIRCKWRVLFISQDPYGFRLQFLIVFITPPLLIVWLFSPDEWSAILRIICVEVLMFLGLWGSGLYALVVVLLKKFLRLFRKPDKIADDQMNIIAKLFEWEEGYETFLAYSVTEWNMENVYFKRLAIEYRSSKPEQRYQKAVEMKRLFFLDGISPYELNVGPGLVSSIIAQISGASHDEYLSEKLFLHVERDVNTNLGDMFSRFQFSEEYGLLKQKASLLYNVDLKH